MKIYKYLILILACLIAILIGRGYMSFGYEDSLLIIYALSYLSYVYIVEPKHSNWTYVATFCIFLLEITIAKGISVLALPLVLSLKKEISTNKNTGFLYVLLIATVFSHTNFISSPDFSFYFFLAIPTLIFLYMISGGRLIEENTKGLLEFYFCLFTLSYSFNNELYQYMYAPIYYVLFSLLMVYTRLYRLGAVFAVGSIYLTNYPEQSVFNYVLFFLVEPSLSLFVVLGFVLIFGQTLKDAFQGGHAYLGIIALAAVFQLWFKLYKSKLFYTTSFAVLPPAFYLVAKYEGLSLQANLNVIEYNVWFKYEYLFVFLAALLVFGFIYKNFSEHRKINKSFYTKIEEKLKIKIHKASAKFAKTQMLAYSEVSIKNSIDAILLFSIILFISLGAIKWIQLF